MPSCIPKAVLLFKLPFLFLYLWTKPLVVVLVSLQVAYDMGDYYHAIPWLEEAVNLFRGSYGEWKTEDEASLEDALDHLAFACFQVGE